MPMPKNYIKKLEYEKNALERRLDSVERGLALFRHHLALEKFQNKPGGDRADWMATADIENWIEDLRMRASFGEIMRDDTEIGEHPVVIDGEPGSSLAASNR
jgi:hypothetical protein